MTPTATYRNFGIAIIDDNDHCAKIISTALKSRIEELDIQLKIRTHSSLNDFQRVDHEDVSVIIIDHKLIDREKPNVLKNLRHKFLNAQIVIVSQEISFRTAVKPIIEGADIYFRKGPDFVEEISSYLIEIISSVRLYNSDKL